MFFFLHFGHGLLLETALWQAEDKIHEHKASCNALGPEPGACQHSSRSDNIYTNHMTGRITDLLQANNSSHEGSSVLEAKEGIVAVAAVGHNYPQSRPLRKDGKTSDSNRERSFQGVFT